MKMGTEMITTNVYSLASQMIDVVPGPKFMSVMNIAHSNAVSNIRYDIYYLVSLDSES